MFSHSSTYFPRFQTPPFRFTWTAISLAAAVFLLAGCVPQERGVTRITYCFWGSTEQLVVERAIIAEFEAQNPGVSVAPMPIGARYAEKVQAMLVGKVAPDVMLTEISFYDDWATRGVLEDLAPHFPDLLESEDLMPVPRQAFQRGERIYTSPVSVAGLVMYYNADALSAAGLEIGDLSTWASIETAGRALARRAGSQTATTDYALVMPSQLMLTWAYGGDLFDDRWHPTRVTINSPESAEALRLTRRLLASGIAAPPEVVNDQGNFQLFRDGKVALYFTGRWTTPEFAGKTQFDWDVAPVPAGPAGSASIHGGSGLSIWSGSPHKEEARRFIQFYTSRRGQELGVGGGRLTPVHRSIAYSEEFLAMSPPASTRVFAETMEAGHSLFPLYGPGCSEMLRVFTGRFEQAISEPHIPEEVILASMDADLSRWLKKRNAKLAQAPAEAD